MSPRCERHHLVYSKPVCPMCASGLPAPTSPAPGTREDIEARTARIVASATSPTAGLVQAVGSGHPEEHQPTSPAVPSGEGGIELAIQNYGAAMALGSTVTKWNAKHDLWLAISAALRAAQPDGCKYCGKPGWKAAGAGYICSTCASAAAPSPTDASTEADALYEEPSFAAVFDFAAWLTCQPGTLLVGAEHLSSAMLERALAYQRQRSNAPPPAREPVE